MNALERLCERDYDRADKILSLEVIAESNARMHFHECFRCKGVGHFETARGEIDHACDDCVNGLCHHYCAECERLITCTAVEIGGKAYCATTLCLRRDDVQTAVDFAIAVGFGMRVNAQERLAAE